jgi:hypothetical protein
VVTDQTHRTGLELWIVGLGHDAILHHKEAASNP